MLEAHLIQAVVIQMLFAVDQLQWGALRDHFADEVHIDYTSLFGGNAQTMSADALLGQWRGLLPGFEATQHMTGPVIVTSSDANTAVAETHVRAYHHIGNETWMIAGHYTMRVVRSGGGWKIASIRLEVYRQEGNTKLPALAMERAKTHPRR
jgi:hypothetical protein